MKTFTPTLACVIALGLSLAGANANAEDAKTTTNTATTTTAAAGSTPSTPKEVCTALADAAKKDDFNTVKSWTLMGAHGHGHGKMTGKAKDKMKDTKQDFHKMHDQQYARLKDLNCKGETIAADHAVVEAESGGEKRLIPFVQKDGKWMFDMHTYMTFYNVEGMHSKMHAGR